MKHTHILFLIVLLIIIHPLNLVAAQEVYQVQTGGTIGFTGVYETKGIPDPAPEVEIKPIFPKEIAQPPLEVRKSEQKRLPQTYESQMSTWKMLGILITLVTLGFWFCNHKKKKTNKESRI
ncbi:cell wall protein [Enterococcus mundtii]|uniref:hypothetical protein n=1 Tax=Enterococcus TaxID=1350 RepID=UPI000445A932|nr:MULTISPECIES: hypothetical protein [Enterococcus]EYT96543.1 hypothetical protein AK89_03385 [Enterococcus mundtii CRL35]MDK4210607.1 cell wall protein [Enterococcus mundtii]MEC3940424.1 cell wall protein [Enterococcus mundtii]